MMLSPCDASSLGMVSAHFGVDPATFSAFNFVHHLVMRHGSITIDDVETTKESIVKTD